MLKQKFTQNDILSMKIQSGEEIICKFISQTDKEYLIERPLALVMMQKGLGFAPVSYTHLTLPTICSV